MLHYNRACTVRDNIARILRAYCSFVINNNTLVILLSVEATGARNEFYLFCCNCFAQSLRQLSLQWSRPSLMEGALEGLRSVSEHLRADPRGDPLPAFHIENNPST